MTRGLLLAADGVDGGHLEYAYHRLREDAVLVDVATPDGDPIEAAAGVREAVTVEALPPDRRYDLVVVPGGTGVDRLAEHASIRNLIGNHLAADGIVCTVADGVRLLIALDVITGRLVTGPEGLQDDLEAADARLTNEAVTVDGPFVTVRDTDALPFGIAAALGSVVIPQEAAAETRERPAWGGPDDG